jgi:hypothetical protein
MKKIRLLYVILIFFTTFSPAYAVNHHVYMGIYAGSDSQNEAAGGWDNEGQVLNWQYTGSAYSIDREMVNWQGKNFAFEQTFMSADNVSYMLDTITYQELELIWYYGRVPMVNLVHSGLLNCQQTLTTLSSNLNNPLSQDYQRLVLWAQGLRNWLQLGSNRFVLLAPYPEANYSSCATEGDPSTWDFVNPQAFKNAYRSARAVIESVVGVDASRIQWFFAPNNVSNEFMPDFEEYYPGSDVVDWLGISTYNFGGYASQEWTFPWQSFRDMASSYLDRLRRLAPRKPLAILQTGSISFGGDKNIWIQEFLQDSTAYPKLYLIIYFNVVKPWDGGFPLGLDWPVYWNDLYDARPYGYDAYFPSYTMRWSGWHSTIQSNDFLIFSPTPMPPHGKFNSVNWNISGQITPISNQYNLCPELRYRTLDFDGDGLSNWDELCAGLDPLVQDKQSSETDCSDGIDNDANGRTDTDDTLYCGDITLGEGETKADYTLLAGEYRYFRFIVPSGTVAFTIRISNATGDVNLYVRHDGRPTAISYDHKSANPGASDEVVSVPSPEPGTWHVLVYGAEPAKYEIVGNNSFVLNPSIGTVNSAVSCDIDGNGKHEIILSANDSDVLAYLNKTRWVNLLSGTSTPSYMACGDIQGSGLASLIGTWETANSMKYFSVDSWEWEDISLPGNTPDSVVVRDIDGDGKAEIIGLFKQSDSVMLRRGSTGLWEVVPLGTYSAPDSILAVNLVGDSAPEVIGLWRSLNQIRAYNFTTSVWTQITLPFPDAPDILDAGDTDNDGIGDLIGSWRSTYKSLQVRSGFTGSWGEIHQQQYNNPDSLPAVVAAADVDADNREDVVAIWVAWAQIKTYLQSWQGWDIMYLGGAPQYVLSGNFDGDSAGRQDVALVWSARIMIWTNNSRFVHVPTFLDVPVDNWAGTHVNALAHTGITTGCVPDDPDTQGNEAQFCPASQVTRQAMAAFIIRAKFGENFTYPATPYFVDVPPSHQFFKYIQKMRELNITTGCNATEYCPGNNVTRAAMAAFIVRALYGETFPCTTTPYFTDVSSGSQFFRYIQKMRDNGITTGCTATQYCPSNNVTRAAMAVFIGRAFQNIP